MKLKVLDLFSGIGGFSLGLERTGGFETVAFCEIEDYPRKVLAKHWPEVPIYDDVRTLTAERLEADGIGSIDVICGGFPCQDISVAGKQEGLTDESRSGLWSECARLLREIQPRFAIFENVTNLLNGNGGDWFKRVLWDISQVGYDAEWHCIPASELGAHHHRDRIWIIAYATSPGANGHTEREETEHPMLRVLCKNVANPQRNGLQGGGEDGHFAGQIRLRSGAWWDEIKELSGAGDVWKVEPSVGRVANGIPSVSHRLKSLGNAVVPQIPEIIGNAILRGME